MQSLQCLVDDALLVWMYSRARLQQSSSWPQWYNTSMHPRSSRPLSDRPSLVTWLATNTSGVSRAQARRVIAGGLLLGLLLGLFAGVLVGTPLWVRMLGVVSGLLGGATLGALGAVLVARLLDWAARWNDPLLGYSGLVRMLLHAGELSLLGAVGGGLGGGIGGAASGLVCGAIAGGVVGGLLYRLRRLGTVLGLAAGLIAGAIGGVIGGVIGRVAS
jgi:hypothetical protein